MKIRHMCAIMIILSRLIVNADTIPVNGLTIGANGMRAGDKLTRKNIHFENNLISDSLSIWDFSSVKSLESETETFYNKVDVNTIVENDNLENRLYYVDSLSINMTRHFRGGMDVKYVMPETMKYPILCGATQLAKYFGEGNLSGMSYIKNAGFVSLSANSVGELITPDGDSIANVLRSHYHRYGVIHIDDDFSRSFGNSHDSTLFSNDSICHWFTIDSITHTIDKWQWYARGYRYPIIEMHKYKTYHYNVACDSILVAYYYPYSSQVVEIVNDSINEYYRVSGIEGYKLPRPASFNNNSNSNGVHKGANESLWNAVVQSQFTCDVHPTLTTGDVTVRLYAEQRCDAVCYCVSSSGGLLWISEVCIDDGNIELKCPMKQLQPGVYFVVCSDGCSTISTKVMKRNDL